jgi:hypothetical protein
MNILAVDGMPVPVSEQPSFPSPKISVWLDKDLARQVIIRIDDFFNGEAERRERLQCRMRCIERDIVCKADKMKKFFTREGLALAAGAPAEKRSAVIINYYARMKEVLDDLSQEEAKND